MPQNDVIREAAAWPVNELGEIVLTPGIGSANIAGFVPSNQIPSDTRTGAVRAVFTKPVTEAVTAGATQNFYLAEGNSVTITPTSATGTITKYKTDNSIDFSTTITSAQVILGPYTGTQKISIVCSTGSVDVAVGSAVSSIDPRPVGLPFGLSWLADSLPNIDLYALGFSAKPTIFFDPSATGSSNLGTINQPFTTQAQLQSACSGDMSGQVLGLKRGTTLRVSGTDGLVLDCNGTATAPFIICPYGDNNKPLPIITAGVVRADWVLHSGSIYKLTGITQNTDVFQADVRLWKKSSLAGVTSAGTSFYDSGATTLYIWAYNSVNPNSVTTEIQGSDYAINVRYSNVAATGHVYVVGLDCQKARNISLRVGRPSVFASMTTVAGLRVVGCRAGQAGYDVAGSTTASDAILVYGASDSVRATSSMIIGCEGYDCLNNSFEVAAMDGLIVEGNYGHDAGGNTILEAWSSCSNMRVRNNIGIRAGSVGRLYTGYHSGGIWAALYNDFAGTANNHAAFQNNYYDFNIIAEAQGQGIQVDGGNGHKVRHNTIYNSPTTPTNRLLNFFTACPIAGTVDLESSNNYVVSGDTGNRIIVDLLQGTVSATDAAAVTVTSTITGDNNYYVAWTTPTAGLRVRTAAGVSSVGQSSIATHKALVTPFDVNATVNWTTASALMSTAYRPLGAVLTGGKTGLSLKRYKDGYVYNSASPAVGAHGF